MNRTLNKVGSLIGSIGLIAFLILLYTLKPYGGSSGAGMAGLPLAFALVIAIGLFFTGVLIIIFVYVKRRSEL